MPCPSHVCATLKIEYKVRTKYERKVDTPTNTILKNGTDDYAVTAGELQIGYDEFKDVETVDVNLILGGKGGGDGNTASTQDTHTILMHIRTALFAATPHRGI